MGVPGLEVQWVIWHNLVIPMILLRQRIVVSLNPAAWHW